MIEMHLNMRQENYALETDSLYLLFEFTSVGPRGSITKVVQYTETYVRNYYTLGLGDLDAGTGEINDRSITNNGDSRKVLATVANTLYIFTSRYPDAAIYARGSTLVRTRLYRMAIANHLIEIRGDFDVYGKSQERWQVFRKNVDYSAFLVKRNNTFVRS
jgi:hypothetical protein